MKFYSLQMESTLSGGASSQFFICRAWEHPRTTPKVYVKVRAVLAEIRWGRTLAAISWMALRRERFRAFRAFFVASFHHFILKTLRINAPRSNADRTMQPTFVCILVVPASVRATFAGHLRNNRAKLRRFLARNCAQTLKNHSKNGRIS